MSKMRAGAAFYECVNRSKKCAQAHFLQLAYEKKASSAELSLNVSYRKQNVREHILLTWLRVKRELAQRTLYMNQ